MINLKNMSFKEAENLFSIFRTNCLNAGMTEVQIVRTWLELTNY